VPLAGELVEVEVAGDLVEDVGVVGVVGLPLEALEHQALGDVGDAAHDVVVLDGLRATCIWAYGLSGRRTLPG
jgi:hypothetical protein